MKHKHLDNANHCLAEYIPRDVIDSSRVVLHGVVCVCQLLKCDLCVLPCVDVHAMYACAFQCELDTLRPLAMDVCDPNKYYTSTFLGWVPHIIPLLESASALCETDREGLHAAVSRH